MHEFREAVWSVVLAVAVMAGAVALAVVLSAGLLWLMESGPR